MSETTINEDLIKAKIEAYQECIRIAEVSGKDMILQSEGAGFPDGAIFRGKVVQSRHIATCIQRLIDDLEKKL